MAEHRSRGDIVTEYPWLVIPFACFNLVSWVLALLEVAGAVGPWAYAAMDALYPVDISFCQMMFWGTLHYGPIADGRLACICRVAFVIEACSYMIRNVTTFHAFTVEDAISYANASAIGINPPVPTLSLVMGALRATFFFIVFGPFAAWLGPIVLQVGRRRLLKNVDAAALPPFSTRFLSWYVIVLSIQLGLCAVCTVLTAQAQTDEELVFQLKLNYNLRSISGVFAQLPGWKALIFDASGKSVAMWRRGEGTRMQTAAVTCCFLFAGVVSVDFILLMCASGSSDPIVLYFHNVIVETGLENGPMMGIWLFGLVNFGISLMHLHPLRDVDKTDQAFLERRAAAQKQKEKPVVV